MTVSTQKVLLWRNLFVITILLVAISIGFAPSSGYAQIDPSLLRSMDFNANSVVDAADLFIFTSLWKSQANAADFDGNNQVDAKDLLLFIQAYRSIITEEPTPTPEANTPTPTNTPGEETPTPTPIPGEDTPTPTPTFPPIEDTPTPTPTFPPIEDTPTPTPTFTPVEDTPTPTPVENTPTPTPTEGPTPTPTPLPIGVLFYTNFDTANTIADAGLRTLEGPAAEEQLIQENRMSEFNSLIPWFVLNANEITSNDFGVAFSQPKSAALNENLFSYKTNQTSVLEINMQLDTAKASQPTLSFQAAFLLETPEESVNDYLVVEVKRSNSTIWEMLDLNGDGTVVTDPTVFDANNPQPLLPGVFDALFGASNPNHPASPLTQYDFIAVSVRLPSDPGLQIAFRFESNESSNREGIYLDNIRVYDAAGTQNEPVIQRVSPLEGTDFYVDTETPALIRGNNLTPAQKVLFSSRNGEQELSFTENADGIAVVIPRLSNPAQEESASLKVVRTDGAETISFGLFMKAAPVPVIDSISPSPFFLNAADSTLHILGDYFRKSIPGVPNTGGTSVIIDVGTDTPILYQADSDFIKRTKTEIVIDGAPLKLLSPGAVSIAVKNEYSGLESTPAMNLMLQSGSGEIQVDALTIEIGTYWYSYNPDIEFYPLQQDQAFTLIWDAPGIVPAQINIDLAGIPFVVNGKVNHTVINERLKELGREQESPIGKATLSTDYWGTLLELSPMILGVTGTITASIRQGNGAPVEKTFALFDPSKPVLYEDLGDWSTQEFSTSDEIAFTVYGDHFRGLSTYGADGESITLLQLIPLDGGDPITLPKMDPLFDLLLISGVGPDNADILNQIIPTSFYTFAEGLRLLVPNGEKRTFKLRALNPDSGKYIDSQKTITFVP